MNKCIKAGIISLAMLACNALYAQIDTRVFDIIDLDYPGLQRTGDLYRAGNTEAAAQALLDYYRSRTDVVHTDIDLEDVTITEEQQKWADEGMEHIFFVHYGYQPSFFYGDDIDWMHWPVKDNELRWQLHRTKWWVPMGKAYRVTGDEKYVREWMYQYVDWIEKNPLIERDAEDRPVVSSGEVEISYGEAQDRNQALIDNVKFAWRPLEVSDRLEFQIQQFAYFISSPSITPEFLSRFLVHYHTQATHITRNFSKQGNHLLFEAQRLTYGGVYFPEYKDAPGWRRKGVEILNREIDRQVYDDGMQFELDPHYHIEAINIFFNALQMMDANGYRGEFPPSYLEKVEKMIVLIYNISFPDYTNPIFGDAKLHEIDYMLPYYKRWTKVFPHNPMIRWMATEGREGNPPSYLSRAFMTSGMYTLRDGWDMDATVMVLKAGPPAGWHNHPDNGTFELWRKGRNFFPDSGSYVYAGDKEIMELRNWFRQTRIHNTLTLDYRDMTGMDSKCVYWSTDGNTDAMAYVNPSYEDLTHRRSVFFVDREFYVIVDEAWGDAAGEVELNYSLVEGEVSVDRKQMSVSTLFTDGNNMSVHVFGQGKTRMRTQEGWVSRAYRSRNERPSFSFYTDKISAAPVRFITVIIPSGGQKQKVSASFTEGFDTAGTSVKIKKGKKTYQLKYSYQP